MLRQFDGVLDGQKAADSVLARIGLNINIVSHQVNQPAMPDYSVKRYSKYKDEELIRRLSEYAQAAGKSYVSGQSFSEATGIAEATITNHFGTWKAFCERAGVAPRYDRAAGKDQLFENLDRVWRVLGCQPRAKEMKQPLSPISISRYQKTFGKPWYDICLEFLSWKSGASIHEIEREAKASSGSKNYTPVHATRREVSLSLRYQVLRRDDFRCVKCGRSPATDRGVQLHVDHIRSWANGGETMLANLQSLCSECNLGKSDKHDG